MQVDDLHHTLDDANYTMSENEKLLSDYRTTNMKRSMELDEVRLFEILYIKEVHFTNKEVHIHVVARDSLSPTCTYISSTTERD